MCTIISVNFHLLTFLQNGAAIGETIAMFSLPPAFQQAQVAPLPTHILCLVPRRYQSTTARELALCELSHLYEQV